MRTGTALTLSEQIGKFEITLLLNCENVSGTKLLISAEDNQWNLFVRSNLLLCEFLAE